MKDIRPQDGRIFSCHPISYRWGTSLWAFGDGEIEVLSSTNFILRCFANPRTGLNSTYEETYNKVALDHEDRLASFLALTGSAEELREAEPGPAAQPPPQANAGNAPPPLPPCTWPRENIAVADLIPYALSDSAVQTLTEQLHAALVETDYFNVLSRTEMKTVLEAQQFQRSEICDDSACLVEMGRILAVQKIIGGSIGLVGSTYNLSIRMVDVETGKTEASVTQQLKGDPDGLLNLVQVAGIQLAAKYADRRK